MSLQEQFTLEAERYVIQADRREKNKLNRKRKKLLTDIEKVEKKIKKVKFKNSDYVFKLEMIGKMKKYVEKYAFLPRSYRNMLTQWDDRSIYFKGNF